MIPRRLRSRARGRADERLRRIVCAELKDHEGSGGTVVTDVSSGYDNRAMAWIDTDDQRPSIGFSV